MPKLEEDGSVKLNENGMIQFVKDFEKLTCFHIAHMKRWDAAHRRGNSTQKTVSKEEGEEYDKSDSGSKAKRKKISTQLAAT